MRFNTSYFIAFLLLFVTEAMIAGFARDNFVRPLLGDFLVVILLYCLLKAFVNVPVTTAAVIVLLLAYIIELAQYLQLARSAGIHHYLVARLVLGTTFSWGDILAYTLGIAAVLIIELNKHKILNINRL